MGKYTGYLICTDCDGTLTYEAGKLSDKNAEAIKYFQSEGGLFTLATGRFPDHLELFKEQLSINAPMVSLNGTMLYDTENKKLINKWPIAKSECLEMFKYIQKNYNEVWDYWMNGIDGTGDFASAGYKPSEHKPDDGSLEEALKEFPEFMLKMVIVSPEDVTLKLQKDLKEKFGEKFRFDTSWPNGLEVQSINSGKGIAVSYMKDKLDKEIHTVIGIGDYENDITLLQYADIGYAVDNALDSVKAVADRITVNNREDALAAIIEEIGREVGNE